MTTTNWRKVLGPYQSALLVRMSSGDMMTLSGKMVLSARALVRRGLLQVAAGPEGCESFRVTEFGQMVVRGTGSLSYR